MAGVLRGEVWLTRFDPAEGSEIKKTRPAVILQNNLGNEYSPLTIVAPLTTQRLDKIAHYEAFIDGPRPSKVLLNQIRSIDKRRLLKRIGMVSAEEQVRIDEALKISFGLY